MMTLSTPNNRKYVESIDSLKNTQSEKFLEDSTGIENDSLANKNSKDVKRNKILAISEGSQVLLIPGDIR